MKLPCLLLLCMILTAPGLALDITTTKGRLFREIKIVSRDDASIRFMHSDGAASLRISEVSSVSKAALGLKVNVLAEAELNRRTNEAKAKAAAEYDARAQEAALREQAQAKANADVLASLAPPAPAPSPVPAPAGGMDVFSRALAAEAYAGKPPGMTSREWARVKSTPEFQAAHMNEMARIRADDRRTQPGEGTGAATYYQALTGPVRSARTQVVETAINGEFRGFENNRIYRMMDVSIWIQTDLHFSFGFQFSPKAHLIPDGMEHRLHVEGEDELVKVRRLVVDPR